MTFHEALLALQKEAITLDIPKTARNPHFKNQYTPLDVVLDKVLPLLHKHEFVLLQTPEVGDDGPVLYTRLLHVPSGEDLPSHMALMAGRADPQGQGAAITYARRYSIMSILGLTSDEDDDGNSSMRSDTGKKAQEPQTQPAQESGSNAAEPFGGDDSPF